MHNNLLTMNDDVDYPDKPLFLINTEKCVSCPLAVCAKVCPVSAIHRLNKDIHLYQIDYKSCIGCGDCFVYCPNNAVIYRNSIEQVKYFLTHYKTVALLDPSISGEFEDITDYRKFVAMIKFLGFDYVHEVSFGVDMVASKYADLIHNYNGKYYIFSTCPVIVNYVRKFHPELINNLAPFVSPAIALAKYLHKYYDEDTKFIFIGPCFASKDEEINSNEKFIDANITFRELRQMFKDSDIQEIEAEYDDFDPPYGNRGALYPLIDGLLYAANCENSPVFSMANRRKSLNAIKTFAEYSTKLQKHFNLFYCQCCSLGPGTTGVNFIISDNAVRQYAQKRYDILDKSLWNKNLNDAVNTDLFTHFVADDQHKPDPSEDKIQDILNTIGHNTKGCQLCGYDSCRDFATNVAKDYIDINSCIVYNMDQKDKSIISLENTNNELINQNKELSDNQANLMKKNYQTELENQQLSILINNLNAGIIIVDSSLTIIKANTMFIKILGEEIAEIAEIIPELIGGDLRSMVPEKFSNLFVNIFESNENITNKDLIINDKLYNISIFPILYGNIAGGIVRDMHTAQIQKEQIINKINDVISENLSMVQQIGFLLGEGASKTEKELNSVINAYQVTQTENKS